jgi:hypothetical protein
MAHPLTVTRQDVPFVLLTLVFLAAIFGAGRYSVTTPAAPTPAPVASETRIVVVREAAPVVVAPKEPEAPLALLPEVEPTPKAVQTPVKMAPKPVVVEAPKAAPVIYPVVLEETPENPYRKNLKSASNQPGF